MGRQAKRVQLSKYELAAQEQIRERNAEQAGQIPEPQLPSTGTARVSAMLAEAQRQREEALLAEMERQREEALSTEAQRQREEALLAEMERQREEALLAEIERQREEALLAEAEPQPEEALRAEAERQREETLLALTSRRSGGSRWSEIVLERRIDLADNPFRPASHDLDPLPPAG